MKFLLATVATLATAVISAPTPEKRDTQFRLPAHMQMFAQISNGTIIGSIKQDGNFTTKRIDPIHFVTYTSGNNGNDGYIDNCSIGNGPLDGAQLVCGDGADPNTKGQFWDRDGFVSIDGPTGIAFSINSLPDTSDSVGVPLIIGGSGSWGQFKLVAHSAQG